MQEKHGRLSEPKGAVPVVVFPLTAKTESMRALDPVDVVGGLVPIKIPALRRRAVISD